MNETVPVIYNHGAPEPPLRVHHRVIAVLVALACLAVLVVAARLTPSPTGVGTHMPLTSKPCDLLARTGMPCPSCGMTTSFAWFTKGNLLASFYVQPMGALLALLSSACVWGGFYIALTGRPAHRLLRLVPARYTLLPLLIVGALAWGWKILIHLNGIDGWNAQ